MHVRSESTHCICWVLFLSLSVQWYVREMRTQRFLASMQYKATEIAQEMFPWVPAASRRNKHQSKLLQGPLTLYSPRVNQMFSWVQNICKTSFFFFLLSLFHVLVETRSKNDHKYLKKPTCAPTEVGHCSNCFFRSFHESKMLREAHSFTSPDPAVLTTQN